jgi:hypothetical protein
LQHGSQSGLKYAVADNETSKNKTAPSVTPRITGTFDCFLDVEGGEFIGVTGAGWLPGAGGVGKSMGGKSPPGEFALGVTNAGHSLGGLDGLGTGAVTFPETADSGVNAAGFLSTRSCALKIGGLLRDLCPVLSKI